MESPNSFEGSQQIKDEFKKWLKNFHGQLLSKNQTLKSSLSDKQQRTSELTLKIEKLSNNFLDTSTLATNDIPNKVQSQLEADINNLKIKSEKLSQFNESINTKVAEETKKMRNKLYEMITKDDLALKPFYEVEEAIKKLKQETDEYIRKQHEDKEIFIKNLKEMEHYYTEIKQSISILEPIEQELRLTIQNCYETVEEKLKSLKLKCVEEATCESSESKELINEISKMKSQQNIQ